MVEPGVPGAGLEDVGRCSLVSMQGRAEREASDNGRLVIIFAEDSYWGIGKLRRLLLYVE